MRVPSWLRRRPSDESAGTRAAPVVAEPASSSLDEPPTLEVEPSPTSPAGASADPALVDAPAPDIFSAIDALSRELRERPDPAGAARLLMMRHEAFAALEDQQPPSQWPRQVPDRFAGVQGCPEVSGDELDADVLASAITNHGCLLVRGLVDHAVSAKLVASIDEAFRACDAGRIETVDRWPGSWYRPFRPSAGYVQPAEGHRGWVRSAGGVLAVDSPPAFCDMIEAFEDAGLREVIGGYLGERPVLSVDKCTLRRVPLDLGGAEWHQDGSFLGSGIRTLNVWLALSPCGGDIPSPGLDLVPKRFPEILPTGTDGAYFDWSIGHGLALRESADTPIIRPTFEAGDALLFDELFLHRTALEPDMTTERYAIESWFFAGSRYPGDSVPVVF